MTINTSAGGTDSVLYRHAGIKDDDVYGVTPWTPERRMKAEEGPEATRFTVLWSSIMLNTNSWLSTSYINMDSHQQIQDCRRPRKFGSSDHHLPSIDLSNGRGNADDLAEIRGIRMTDILRCSRRQSKRIIIDERNKDLRSQDDDNT